MRALLARLFSRTKPTTLSNLVDFARKELELALKGHAFVIAAVPFNGGTPMIFSNINRPEQQLLLLKLATSTLERIGSDGVHFKKLDEEDE